MSLIEMKVGLIENDQFNEIDTASRLFDMHKDERSRVTVYVDTEKRQSVAIQNGIEYITVEKALKRINSNPAHYEMQTAVIIQHLWKSYVRYIVLIIFITVLMLTFFLNGRAVHVCIAMNLLLVLMVICYYCLRYYDRTKWVETELQRINEIIDESNANEFIVKKDSAYSNWIDYANINNSNDPNDVNNVHYVKMKCVPLSNKEINETVIKFYIQIWLGNKQQFRNTAMH